MATISLSNSFLLDAKVIDKQVTCKMGIYVLGPDGGNQGGVYPRRAGRSDDNEQNLAGRIKSYINKQEYNDCTHFVYQQAGSVKEAYELESLAYHKWKSDLAHNEVHPKRPDNTTAKTHPCPHPGCTS